MCTIIRILIIITVVFHLSSGDNWHAPTISSLSSILVPEDYRYQPFERRRIYTFHGVDGDSDNQGIRFSLPLQRDSFSISTNGELFTERRSLIMRKVKQASTSLFELRIYLRTDQQVGIANTLYT